MLSTSLDRWAYVTNITLRPNELLKAVHRGSMRVRARSKFDKWKQIETEIKWKWKRKCCQLKRWTERRSWRWHRNICVRYTQWTVVNRIYKMVMKYQMRRTCTRTDTQRGARKEMRARENRILLYYADILHTDVQQIVCVANNWRHTHQPYHIPC